MKTLYTIFDRAAEAIGPIMQYAHDAAAVRAFGDACSDSQSMISRHPADFELRAIAVINDRGELVSDESPYPGDQLPRTVITGEQWKNAQAVEEVSNG